MRSCFQAGVLLFLVLCLSGCTMPDFGWNGGGEDGPVVSTLTAEVYAEPERVPEKDFTYLNLVVVNPSSFEYAALKTYKVKARIFALPIFDTSSEKKEQAADLIGVRQKRLTWKLVTPEVPTEVNPIVIVHMEVEKEADFTMPPIVFATKDAKVARDIANDPIPPGPKTMTIQDNFANIEIELNQEPPIMTEKVYANLRFFPTMDGVINITSVKVDSGSCDKPDQIAKTVHCEFSQKTDSITEARFILTVHYAFSSNIGHTITIYPQ